MTIRKSVALELIVLITLVCPECRHQTRAASDWGAKHGIRRTACYAKIELDWAELTDGSDAIDNAMKPLDQFLAELAVQAGVPKRRPVL